MLIAFVFVLLAGLEAAHDPCRINRDLMLHQHCADVRDPVTRIEAGRLTP